jgi:predicted phage replisome organizer
MAEVKWVKLTTDMFDNRKIKHIRRLPEGNNIVLIWVMLLTMAGRCNSGGMIFLTENIPYTPKMLADELDFEETTVVLALKALEQLDMIVTENGFFSIVGWEEYQNIDRLSEIREQNRLAQQRSRAKKKQLQASKDGVNDTSYDSNMTCQRCHDTEEEREEDKEKEFHSFSLSESDKEKGKREFLGGTLGGGVVMLSEEEVDKLLTELSYDEFNHYVGIVRDCEKKGLKYRKKTHYQAIMEMATADRLKATKPRTTKTPKPPKNQPGSFNTFDTDEFYRANVRQSFGEDFEG